MGQPKVQHQVEVTKEKCGSPKGKNSSANALGTKESLSPRKTVNEDIYLKSLSRCMYCNFPADPDAARRNPICSACSSVNDTTEY